MGKKSALITASATIIAAIIGATVGRVFEQKISKMKLIA